MWDQFARNKKVITWLFRLWLFFLPFDGSVLSFSLGFITVFPTLIVLLLLQPSFLFSWKKVGAETWLLLGLLLLFTIHTIGFVVYEGFSSYAKFDLHTLMLWMLTTTSLIGVYLVLGIQAFKKEMFRGLLFFLAFILLFGFFEFFTGIHFQSKHTDLLSTLAVGNVTYAPVYLYQNVNDYCVYVICLIVLTFWMCDDKKKYFFLFLTLLITALFFSSLAQARGAQFATVILIVMVSLREVIQVNLKKIAIGLGSLFLAFFLVLSSNKLFFGPKYDTSVDYRLNEMMGVEKIEDDYRVYDLTENISKEERVKLSKRVRAFQYRNMESNSIRKNLYLNSFDLIKEHPIFGVGPSAFSELHLSGKVKRDTGGMSNPHNLILEMLTKYGTLAGLFFAFLFGLLFIRIWTSRKLEVGLVWGLGAVAFFIMTMIPATFMYLNLLWLFCVIVLVEFLASKKRIDVTE